MSISSNSFFHFTSGKQAAFLGILQDGFRITVSHEVTYNKNSKSILGFPMVCFCDIPLSVVDNHVKNFCQDHAFGFGLARKWGEVKLQPVQYYPMQQDNFFQQHLSYLTDLVLKNPEILKDTPTKEKIWEQLKEDSFEVKNGDTRTYVNWLTGLIKPVQSDYYRFYPEQEKIVCTNKNYLFYNEREWRHIDKKMGLVEIPYKTEEDPTIYNVNDNVDYKAAYERLWMHYGKKENYLKFKSEDLTWLIVENEDSVFYITKLIMCSDFKSIGGYPINDVSEKYSLIQKIVSYDRIRADVFIH